MNDILVSFGIQGWKPWLESVLQPPVPFIVLILVGARLMFRNRLAAWALLVTGCAGIWLATTPAMASLLTDALLRPPRALGPADIAELRRAPKTAIVVLGAGAYVLSPEYGVSNLKPLTIERLRYGIWLARETSLPVLFSGGSGYADGAGPSEAEIAARIADREFGRPLRWAETQSRDTHENAFRSVALLQGEAIRNIVLVTHGFHMRRALGDFERANQSTGAAIAVRAAPMGLRPDGPLQLSDWIPSPWGYERTRIALHEWLGRLAGA